MTEKMLEVGNEEAPCRSGSIREGFLDAARLMSRALAAEHYYATLRVASDHTLAGRGLTRRDVPRAVYRMLIWGRCGERRRFSRQL